MSLRSFLQYLFVIFTLVGMSTTYAIELNSTNITQAPFNCLISDQTCHLSNKNITSVAPGTFDNHANLVTVDLTYNQIIELPAGLFDNNPHLLQFAIYFNQLTSFPAGLFDNNPDLDYFSPASNQLTTLPEGFFDNNPNLRNFNIASNQLTSLPDDLFAHIPAFNSLRLDNNKLTQLSDDFFSGISLINNLQLNNNKLTNIPLSLQFITTGVNNLQVGGNCMTSGLSDGTIAYLDTYADDSPLWSEQQNGCDVDFNISQNFLNDPINAGLSSTLQFFIGQYYDSPSSGNYLEVYGLDDVMTLSLIENPGWISPSLGVYRYDLSDYSSFMNETLSLVGVIKQSQGGSSVVVTGTMYTSSTEIDTGNNTAIQTYYISPTTDYGVSGVSTQTGQSGDIKTISIDYNLASGGYSPIDSLVLATLSSGVSMVSSGWQNGYVNGGLLMSGDICYEGMLNQQGPYYIAITQYIANNFGFSSVDEFLVQQFGFSSDPSLEMQRFVEICTSPSYMGYDSFAICLNEIGMHITKDTYPQCGGPKSFAHTGDVCYDDFVSETGIYYTEIEDHILNSYSYPSVHDWLLDRYGLNTSPGEESDAIEYICFSYMSYSTLDQCLLERFNLDVKLYSSTCGYDELPTLLSKLISSATSSLNIDVQLNTDIQSGDSLVSQFVFLPSFLDIDMNDNIFVHSFIASGMVIPPTTGIVTTGVNGIGGGGGPLLPSVPADEEMIFTNADIFNPTIANGYCYNVPFGPSIMNSSAIETSDEFKKALAFMSSYGLTKFDSVQEFDPYTSLTREQAAKFFTQFAINVLCRKTESALSISYNDINKADSSLKTYIAKAYQLGLMKGGTDGNFRPKDYITKAEFNAVIVRMILKTYLPEDRADVWYSEYNRVSRSLGIVKYGAASRSLMRNDATLILFRTYKNHSFSLQNIPYESYVISNRSSIMSPYDQGEEIQNPDNLSGDVEISSGSDSLSSSGAGVSIQIPEDSAIENFPQRISRPQMRERYIPLVVEE